MVLSWFRRLKESRTIARPRQGRVPTLEGLDARILPAVSALFIPQSGLLTVFGDAGDNAITVSRDAAGKILVNGGAVPIVGNATVANTTTITVFGQNGNDVISLDEANGALPKAQLFGGNGDDVLTGGSGDDLLFGQNSNDVLLGKGGNDLLFGGAGNDVLTGGRGNDQAFGEAGDDRMIWNPGDGSALNEGGSGNDVVEVNGGNTSENFTVTANGSRVRFDRASPAPFFLDVGSSENLVVNMNGGDDTFTAGDGLANLISLTVDGGAGNDRITGGDGNDRLSGGDGNDVIRGGRGADVVRMGDGDDTFVWDPGEGSDVVEGEGGHDTMVFDGSDQSERFDLTANGPRLRFTRNLGGIVMDVNGVEQVDVNALGGADVITIGDLTGTGVTELNLNLGVGDNQPDVVIVKGTAGDDSIVVASDASGVTVLGLPAQVHVVGSEPTDQLEVDAGVGNDVVQATGLAAGAIRLTADGGDGDDLLVGSAGNDVLHGGAGDDVLVAGSAQNVLDGGPGANVLIFAEGTS